MRPLFRAALTALLLAAAPVAARAAEVTIHRDRYGVPSIVAGSLPDAMYGLGHAVMTDNAARMALNFKQARGRLAEVEGRGQLLADGFIRSLGIEALAEAKAAALSGEEGQVIRAFCDGANAALAERRGKLPAWIEPVTPVDVLAMAQLLNVAFPLQEIAGQLLPGQGSNQFAVAPRRTAAKRATLSADPHLPWDGILAWYEFGIQTPAVKFRGVTLPGLPYGLMGHTDRVAWSMTNNDPDLWDFYTVKTNPDDRTQYSFHGEWRPYRTVPMELRYLDGGELKTQRQTARVTEWGPLAPLRAQAVKISGLGDWSALTQAIAMLRARTGREFREALRPRGLTMWNIVYADTAGNIGYQFNARVPKRDPSFDWRKPVPGDDPRTKWGALYTLDELPHAENPKSGLLVNANSAPWLTPLGPEIGKAWPSTVTTHGRTTRFDRLAGLLSDTDPLKLDDAKAYATDTRVPYALPAMGALRVAADAVGGPSAADAAKPLEVLARWNKRAEVDSKGAALYVYWLRADRARPEMARRANFGEEWTASEQAAALAALKAAADQMTKDHGRLDLPWGEFHRTRRGDRTVAVNGYGPAAPGDQAAAVVPNWGVFRNGRIDVTGGSSFRMIVDLNPKRIRSWSILPYGNSQDPASPHFADQLPLFAAGKYKETRFSIDEIRKYSVETVRLRR
jgi:acyl-homoserine lactone acylase PvdQ